MMDDVVTPTPASMRSLYDLLAQLCIECTGLALMAVAVSAKPHNGAGVAFEKMVSVDHDPNILAFDLWG